MRYRPDTRAFVLPLLLFAAGCGRDAALPATTIVQALEVPAVAGSRSPNLATGPDGSLLLSWIAPAGDGHALRYARLANGQWSTPREVARGANWFVNWADFPSVVPLADDLIAAHWLVSQPAGGYAYDVLFSLSQDGGASWSAPLRPHTDGTATEHGFVTIYPHADGAGLVWLDGRKMVHESAPGEVSNGMTVRAAVITPELTRLHEQEIDGLTCDCCQTDVAVTAAGPVALYRDRTSAEVRDIYVTRGSADGWEPGRPIAHDAWNIAACPVNGPTISAVGDELAVAWFTAANNLPAVRLTISKDAGATFSEPVEIATGRVFGRVGIALLPDGSAAVSWLGKTAGQQGEIRIVRVSADGRVGTALQVGQGQTISGFTVPQLKLFNGQLVMAWTAEIDGEHQVQSASIPLAALLQAS